VKAHGIRLAALALAPMLASVAVVSTVYATRGASRPSNIAATRSYLRARHAYEQAITGDGPRDRASANAFVGQVTAGCRNVLSGPPPGKATEEIAREAGFAVGQAFESPERRPTIAFARKIERLRWTSRLLTYYVRGFAAETRAMAELVAPDLCADARAVAASRYKTVPTTTTRYISAYACASSKVLIENSPGETGELDEIIAIMLRPYERPDERSLIPRRLSKRERESKERSESRPLLAAESELKGALGLPNDEPRQALGEGTPSCLLPRPR
jgi:hypothetical protein